MGVMENSSEFEECEENKKNIAPKLKDELAQKETRDCSQEATVI